MKSYTLIHRPYSLRPLINSLGLRANPNRVLIGLRQGDRARRQPDLVIQDERTCSPPFG